MADYNEKDSDHGAHTYSRKDHVGEEDDEDYSRGDSVEVSQIKNNGSSDKLNPLTEDFNILQNLLKRELQKFQELGREEPITLLHDEAESISCIHEASPSRRLGSESLGELGLTSLDSEILNLVNNVEHMEIKLNETKCILEDKESQIRELEATISVSESPSRGKEIRIEDVFQQKMEAEIVHLIFSRSVANFKRRIKLIEEEKISAENEAHKMLSKLTEAETKAENLKNQAQELQKHCVEITEIREVKSFKKRVFKTMSCLLLQLGLMFVLFSFQLMPESETLVPT